MPQRKEKPKVDLGPDYYLVCKASPRDDLFASAGSYYAGSFEGIGIVFRLSNLNALKLKGPGLASAERALARRGYVVERVLA